MLVKALRSFSGPEISMATNEIRDIPKDEAKHLILAGHVEAYGKQEKAVKADDSKPGNKSGR